MLSKPLSDPEVSGGREGDKKEEPGDLPHSVNSELSGKK